MSLLLRIKGFLPFLLIVFVNAFMDLGHKIIIQNTVFKAFDDQQQIILTAIVNALILLPFILLFTPSGWVSDRFKKPQVIRSCAAVAVVLALLITYFYYQGLFVAAFAMTLLMGAQSAIYAPAKYGYIREMVGKSELAIANGFVQAITIISILAGIFVFSIFFESSLTTSSDFQVEQILRDIAPLGWILVGLSVTEFLLASQLCRIRSKVNADLYVPETLGPDSNTSTLSINENIAEEFAAQQASFDWNNYLRGKCLKTNLKSIFAARNIWLSIIGLSIFWGISQVLLAAFPSHAKANLGMENTVLVQGLLAASGIGIALGSMFAGKASKRHIETGLIPVGALGVVIGLLILPQLTSPTEIALTFAFLGASGGIFIVPLNALIQFHAPEKTLGTVLAGSHWIQNLVMLSFLGITSAFAYWGINAIGLFWMLAILAIASTIYTLKQLPHSFVRYIVSCCFSGAYKVDVIGFNNLPSHGAALLLGNHISWLDWAMIQIACPRKVRFVMHRNIYQRWYLKWALDLAGVVPISSGNSKVALEEINAILKAGEVVCLFPEGGISRNGQISEFKRGFERCIDDVEGVIIPFYLRGLWGSRFSRSNAQLRKMRAGKLRRDIIVAFGQPLPINSKAETVKQHVSELSISAWKQYIEAHDSLAKSWISTAKKLGRSLCLADIQGGTKLSGYQALTGTLLLSNAINHCCKEQNIGLLLPSSCGGLLSNMAAVMAGKTLVNLNYTASQQALSDALSKAEIKTIITSQRFLTKLQQRGIEIDSVINQQRLVFVEDLLSTVSPLKKALYLGISILLPKTCISWLYTKPYTEAPAAILFSSGSEGSPKGVMLSESNILANIRQISDVLDTVEDDRILSTLPLFHAFGLTATGLMPMVEGIPAICHPDPTDTVTIAKGTYQFQATIMCATSTFLKMFTRNRRVQPLMMSSLRIVVAGAERLSTEVRTDFQQKFGKTIYEGYGTSETTPVASVNVPDRLDPVDWEVQIGNKPGTVGMPLPGSSFRIVDPDTLAPLPRGEAGLILIGGLQVMRGYLNDPARTEEVIEEIDGQRWYRSGDKGYLDQGGFLVIVDRYSRFAKIGGEMISLSAVETALATVLPEDTDFVASNIPDPTGKGEKIALLIENDGIDPEKIKATIRQSGMQPLMQPKVIILTERIPRLATGKIDFQSAKKLIQDS